MLSKAKPTKQATRRKITVHVLPNASPSEGRCSMGFRLCLQMQHEQTTLDVRGAPCCTGCTAPAQNSGSTGNALSQSCCSNSPAWLTPEEPSWPKAAPTGLGQEQGGGRSSAGASQGEMTPSPPRSQCPRGPSVPSWSHLNYRAARRDTRSRRPVGVWSSPVAEAVSFPW